MTSPGGSGLDEQLLDAVNAIAPVQWSGHTFRFTTARRDPLSGEGARLNGGRWNPPDLFPVIYLARPESTCMRELGKWAEDNHLDVETQLQVPYRFHTIAVSDVSLLDLTDESVCDKLGLVDDDFVGPWSACQPIGHAAWFLEFGGVLAPSATGSGLTVALFEHRTAAGQIAIENSEELTFDLYKQLVDEN